MLRPMLAALLALGSVSPSFATAPREVGAGPMTPAERGAATRAFVKKWGGYVQRVEGIPVRTWAMRMVPGFTEADPDNFRRALVRETLEGALAELGGRGDRVSDAQIIDAHARAGRAGMSSLDLKVLGSISNDLVFTPVVPCRLADTRVAGGPIPGNTSRAFLAVAANVGANFTSQGGSNTNCNLAGIGATAVAINVTAVFPSGAGFATIYRSGDVQPLAASLTFPANQLVNNTVIVRIPNPLGITDFVLYTSAQSHYVVDIVGYYSAPQATSFDCVNTSVASTSIAANSVNFFNNPACPAGYRATTPYCWTAASGVYSQGSGFNANSAGNATFCAWQNTTGASQTVFGGNVCCRVPGQ